MLEGYVLEIGLKEIENEKVLYIHRIRFDKGELEVNFKTIVEKTWKDMQNELTLPYLVKYINKEVIEEIIQEERSKKYKGNKIRNINLFINFIYLHVLSYGERQELIEYSPRYSMDILTNFEEDVIKELNKYFTVSDKESNITLLDITGEGNVVLKDYFKSDVIVIRVNNEYQLNTFFGDSIKNKIRMIGDLKDGSFIYAIFNKEVIVYETNRVIDVDIIESCLYNYRKAANEIKRNLINRYCKEKTVLDIGSGKGGDLNKYDSVNVKKVYLTEPNEENIKELKERINSTSVKNKSVRENIGGEESDKIKTVINEKVDVVNMFFVLSFFYSKKEMLEKLVDTIDNSLKEDGYFITTFLDGLRISKILQVEPKLITPCYSVKTVDYDQKRIYGNEITIDLKGTPTATLQTEWLIYINELARLLSTRGIYIEEIKEFNELVNVSELKDDEKYLFSFYSSIVFKRELTYTNVPNVVNTYNKTDNILIRLPAKMDGSCFFHSLLYGISGDLSTYDNVVKLRILLHNNFTVEKYEKLGKICIIKMQELFDKYGDKCVESINNIKEYVTKDIEYNNVREYINKSPLSEEEKDILMGLHLLSYKNYLKILETPSVYIEGELIPYIEYELNVNIYGLDADTSRLHYMTNEVKNNDKPNILLYELFNEHFEKIVKIKDINDMFVEEVYDRIFSKEEIRKLK